MSNNITPLSAHRNKKVASPSAQSLSSSSSAPTLDDPALYLNRELTWLQFNHRVLSEACNEQTPLLERLKFFAIFASNIDEFFMKRIGGLKLQAAAGVAELSVDGRTPQQQLSEVHKLVEAMESERDRLLPQLLAQLAEHDIKILAYRELDANSRAELRRHYIDNIFPLVTPQVIDPAHPFPFISNLSLNIFVALRTTRIEAPTLARVKAPVGGGIERFIRVGEKFHFVPLEDVMANHLELLFPEVEIIAHDFCFIARNAAAERNESDVNDLMELIELELRDRRLAPIVRMVVNRAMSAERQAQLAGQLGLSMDDDVYVRDGLLMQRELMQLANLPIQELRYPPHAPVLHHRLADSSRDIFQTLRDANSILLQHPYESFTASVVRLLKESARDAKVRAIKMTLYRTDRGESNRIVDFLIDAAHNGKQVAVVVELKAKFDEAANIEWSGRMERAGIHVTYGVVGFKTHCKLLMVVRSDDDGLRRYVHIGTGNYHAGTARLYTDLGLLSCDAEIGGDVTELFNYLTTGCAAKRDYRKIFPAPSQLKPRLLEIIDREIEAHRRAVAHNQPNARGLIQIKVNALEDKELVSALYRASQAGVTIDLIVRDTCRLRPNLRGVSDNIRVRSIVGRFLEHSRFFYFRNGGDEAGEEEFLIGSADLMRRNLESRVEVVVRVTEPELQAELRRLFDAFLADNQNAWEMRADGAYQKCPAQPNEEFASQQKQIDFARARLEQGRDKLRDKYRDEPVDKSVVNFDERRRA